MPDTTPIYGFLFPEPTDPPDGPGGLEDLALGVEGELSRIEGGVPDSLDTRLDAVENGVTQHVFTASGSLAAATVAGAKKLLIRGVGGGGGGGGAAATPAGQYSHGAGGQGGTYGEVLLTVSGLVFPLQVTVGAGGAGVSGATGAAGDLSRVRGNNGAGTIHFEVNGGAPGEAVPAAAATIQGTGGAAAAAGVATFLVPGGAGGGSWMDTANFPHPGAGGGSVLGMAAAGGAANFAGNIGGAGGANYGGGGSGSSRRASQTALPGGAGAAGIVIIEAVY